MDSNEYDLDVVIIQGDLSKVKKFYRCRVFCDDRIWEDYDKGRVVGCFGTSCIDIEFDHPRLVFQINVQWPHEWLQWRQRIGRLARQGQESESHLLLSFNDYVFNAVGAQQRRFDPNLSSSDQSVNILP
eukprot:scaffold19824_cov62-Cyclotella_meneghiniana.AAC.10